LTTALLWWFAVLGSTWGLVVAVRAWRWSPEQHDPSELRTRHLAARLALLPVLVLLALAWFLSSVLLGWSTEPPGWTRVLESLPLLGSSALAGLGAVACVRAMVGLRLRSWWLLAGLLPAVGRAAMLFGA
jgi:hypothetical protein